MEDLHYNGGECQHYPPPPPKLAVLEEPPTEEGDQRGETVEVKIDGPVLGLSLSKLTDSWHSTRSWMKNYGERETTVKGPL